MPVVETMADVQPRIMSICRNACVFRPCTQNSYCSSDCDCTGSPLFATEAVQKLVYAIFEPCHRVHNHILQGLCVSQSSAPANAPTATAPPGLMLITVVPTIMVVADPTATPPASVAF